jgi:hypothetical protein
MPSEDLDGEDDAPEDFAARRCEFSGEPLDPETGHCGFHDHTYCPFCGAAGGVECPHLLATWGNELGYDGPPLPMPLQAVERLADLSYDEKQRALGEFFPLCGLYEEYLDNNEASTGSFSEDLNENWLTDELLCRIPAYVAGLVVASWEPSGPGGGQGDVWYAPQPDEARAQLAALNDRILRTFQAAATRRQ